MKKIINNVLYDTEKANKIYDYIHMYTTPCFFDNNLVVRHKENATIYKTKKGNYFIHFHKHQEEGLYDRERIEKITEDKIKQTISNLDPDEYIKIFGKIDLEEA